MHQFFYPKGFNKVLVMRGLASALLAAATSRAQFSRLAFSGAGDFSESAILHGVKATCRAFSEKYTRRHALQFE